MPKDVIINQNGISSTLEDVKYIETYKKDGGTEKWIPEDDAKRTVLETNQPGTYTPPLSSGFVGYSEVTVDGLMPIEDEEEYPVLYVTQNGIYQPEKDPRGPVKGYSKIIVSIGEREISKIVITNLPDKLIYTNGEDIQYSGIAVKGYDEDNNYVRDIDFNELVFPQKLAVHEGNADEVVYPADTMAVQTVQIDETENVIPLFCKVLDEFIDFFKTNGYEYVDDVDLYATLSSLINDPYKPASYVSPVSITQTDLDGIRNSTLQDYHSLMIECAIYIFDNLQIGDSVVTVRDNQEATKFAVYLYARKENSVLRISFPSNNITTIENTNYPVYYGKVYVRGSNAMTGHDVVYGSNINVSLSAANNVPVHFYRQSDGRKLEAEFGINISE